MGKCTLAPFSPTPRPAVPRSPSQCGTTQGSSRTCPANSQVLLESPPSSLSSLRDSAFITFPTSPPPESPLNPLPISREVFKAQSEGWHSLIQPTIGSSPSSLEGDQALTCLPDPHACPSLPKVTHARLCKLGGSGQNLLHLSLTPPPRTCTPFCRLPRGLVWFPVSSDWGAELLGSRGKACDDMRVGAPALNITPLSPLKAQLISRMEEDVCFSDSQPQDLSPRRALRSSPPGCLSPWLDTGQNRSQGRGQGAPGGPPLCPQPWRHRLWASGGWGLAFFTWAGQLRPPTLRPKAGSDLDPLSLSPSILKTYTSPILSLLPTSPMPARPPGASAPLGLAPRPSHSLSF